MLSQLIAAQHKISVPFIGFDGTTLIRSGISDDLGIFYFIPKIASLFGLSLQAAINSFFYSLIVISAGVALISFFALYERWLQRLICIVGLALLSWKAVEVGDVYIVYATSIMMVVPAFLYYSKKHRHGYGLLIGSFCIGIFLGIFNAIRALASFSPLLFALILLVGYSPYSVYKKTFAIFLLIVGLFIPYAYFMMLFKEYELFAQQSLDAHFAISHQHIFWHPIYLGFGFLSNPFGIQYDDMYGYHKALSIDPTALYPGVRYEQVIKQEVINLLKHHRFFVIKTIFAKLGVLFYFFLRYTNIGLCAALLYRKPFIVDFAFFVGLASSSLFGLLVMPHQEYIFGFIAFSSMYAIVSINYALEQMLTKRHKKA